MLHPLSLTEEHVSGEPSNSPVYNLDEGDDAEAKAEPKEASKRGDKVHGAHPDAPLQLYKGGIF